MLATKKPRLHGIQKSVPSFPDFRPFLHADKDWYTKFYANFEPYADFAFGNLLIWLNFKDDLEISKHNGNLIFRFTNILTTNSKIHTLLGGNKIDETIHHLVQEKNLSLSFVPEVSINGLLSREKFRIDEERESFDYILDTHRMAHLLGAETRKLRREVRTSIKEYGEHITLKELDLEVASNVGFLINNLHLWDKAFKLTDNDKEGQEIIALNKSLVLSDVINNKNFSIFIDGKLEGFIIYQQPPQENYVILNHIKTSYNFRYIFDFMMFAFAARVHQSNVKFINFEQDLGLQGLRTHKMSLKPVRFLKKYTVTKL